MESNKQWVVTVYAESGVLRGRFHVDTMSEAGDILLSPSLGYPEGRFVVRIENRDGEGWWTAVCGCGGDCAWIRPALDRIGRSR